MRHIRSRIQHGILRIGLTVGFVSFLLASVLGQGEAYLPISYNYQFENPAAPGLHEKQLAYIGGYRKNWGKWQESPRTLFAGYSHSLNSKMLGLGAFVVSDYAALLRQNRLHVFGALHLNQKKSNKFSIGVAANIHSLRLAQGNVIDNIALEGESGLKVYLGTALNYHRSYGSNKSYVNLMINLPQVSSETLIKLSEAEGGQQALTAHLPGNIIVQANLKQQIPNKSAAILAFFRLHSQKGNQQIDRFTSLDASLGVSLRNDAFQFRFGVRNVQRNQIYGGIGVNVGRSNLSLQVEPDGSLGPTFSWQSKDPDDKTLFEWQKWNALEGKLRQEKIKNINVTVFNISGSDHTLIAYSFEENRDRSMDLVEDKVITQLIDIPKLLKVIDQLIQEIQQDKGQLLEINYIAEVNPNRSRKSGEEFTKDEQLNVDYLKEGRVQVNKQVEKGDRLNPEEIAAVKLFYLNKRLDDLRNEKVKSIFQVEENKNLKKRRKITIELKILSPN
ncbi:MAG: type IX secretion system membrane protein PorP/SprF [Bacteroidota bacterium]